MDLTFYTILVPIGSSEQLMITLEQAERIAFITKGNVHNKIVELADLVGAKLIVMGTNGTPSSFS